MNNNRLTCKARLIQTENTKKALYSSTVTKYSHLYAIATRTDISLRMFNDRIEKHLW